MYKLIDINKSRYKILETDLHSDYFLSIIQYITKAKQEGTIIYPKGPDIFRAFDLSPRQETQVVILGQDPYHSPNQAHGLCFSVPEGITPPPSLINIYKEMLKEYPEKSIDMTNGDLSNRAKQGVLLLNAFLTVENGKPLSHSNIGREMFTDQIISLLSEQKEGLVFILRGSFAKSKARLINNQKHLVLTANHPSPLSANRGGWFGNNHFLQANEYLEKQGKKAINW